MADLAAEKPDWKNTENFDAEVVKESIATGEDKIPETNVAADYDAAQEMSTGIVDAETAEAMVAPQFEVARPDQVSIGSSSANTPDSNPSDYLDMAKEINPAPTGSGNVTDELMEKAIAKGQAGGN